MTEDQEVACPYCGEVFTATLDPSAGDQQYIEDCPVCCQPIEFDQHVDEDGARVTVRSQDET